MILKMFSIWDDAAKCHMTPFCMSENGEAIRAFHGEANNPESNINRYAEQFVLYQVAEFDGRTGEVIPCDRRLITTALEQRRDNQGDFFLSDEDDTQSAGGTA